MPRPRGSAQLQRDARSSVGQAISALDGEINAAEAQLEQMRARRQSLAQAESMIGGDGAPAAAGRRASGAPVARRSAAAGAGTRRQAAGSRAGGATRKRAAAAGTTKRRAAGTTKRKTAGAAKRQAAGRRATSAAAGATAAASRRQRGPAKKTTASSRRRAGGRPAAGSAGASATKRRATTGAPTEQRAQQVVDYLRGHGGQALPTDIAKGIGVSPQRTRALLETMKKQKVVVDLGEHRPEGWRGRSPHMWGLKKAA